jgi:TetR/AcrR family transcriptional repressor of bet genes
MRTPAFTRIEVDARRSALIEATARVLARDGADASVRAIAAEAGVSPGLVTHHFGGVDALIAATYIQVDATVGAAMAAAVDAAGPEPRARLLAYVSASFAPPIAEPALLGTWIAFWSLARRRAEIADLHARHYAAYRAALETLLAACGLAEGERRRGAIGLAALIDGLWLELCLSPGLFTPEDARTIAERQIAAALG